MAWYTKVESLGNSARLLPRPPAHGHEYRLDFDADLECYKAKSLFSLSVFY